MTRFTEVSSALTHRLLHTHDFALLAADAVADLAVPVAAVHTGYGVLKDSDSLLPVLIDLKALSPAQKQLLLEQFLQNVDEAFGDEYACPNPPPLLATLLQSDVSVDVLAHHLGMVQLVQTKQQKKAWLRVHDGRVMAQLDPLLSDVQWQGLLGPVNTWTCFAYGYWLGASKPAKEPRVGTVALRLDTPTMHALERIGVINRSLPLVHCTSWRDVQTWSHTLGAYAQAARDQYSLTATTELTEYVRLCVQVHPRFDAHPAVQQLIQDYLDNVAKDQAQEDMEPLMNVLTGQVTEFWSQVKADLRVEKIEERV